MVFLYKKRSAITLFILILVGIIFSLPEVTRAQQQSVNESRIFSYQQLKLNHLQKQIKRFTGKSRSDIKPPPVNSGIDYKSVDQAFTIFEQDQSWNLNPNPNQQQNFALFKQGKPAGNVNGDSTNGNPVDDFIVTSIARDEQTSTLEDQTWKTAVFFGGNTSGTPDQIISRKLIPVGDLNGDGYSDAVAAETNLQYPSIDNQPAYVYEGTANGYVQTSRILYDGFLPSQKQIAFRDFNADGYADVLSYYPDNGDVIITWGAPLFSDISSTVHSTVLTSTSKRVVIKDVDNDDLDEMVSFGGMFGDGEIQIAEIDTTALTSPSTGIQTEQTFAFTLFTGYADEHELHLIDINGSGYPEIYISTEKRGPKYVIEYDSTNNQYFTSASEFFYGLLTPAGDLNNDGNFDFIQGDSTASYKAYISYGSSDLGSPPALDVGLSGNSSTEWNWEMQYNPYSTFGDFNGDGIDDVLLAHTEKVNNDYSLGRRILSGSTSGSFNSAFHLYSQQNFFSRIFGTEEIGDINGDGIEDFAVGGEGNKVNVFYGGNSISQTPDMIIAPDYLLSGLTSGDFTGDGKNDLLVLGHYDEQGGGILELYEGGASMDAVADYSVSASDFQTVDYPEFNGIQNIGDVNADGTDDFLTGSSMAHDSTGTGLSYLNEAYIFYGGSSISGAPDATIPMGESNSFNIWAGETAAALGDMNGDGINDFAVSAAFALNADESGGKVFVFYGGASKTFTDPDLVFKPEKLSFGFGWGISAGDFTGDGQTDMAISALGYNSSETEPPTAIHVYHGGTDFDNQADQFLALPNFAVTQSTVESNGYLFSNDGTIETISDYTNDGRDELLFSSSSNDGGNHAALYTFTGDNSKPTGVLKAPNRVVGLGETSNIASGDFTNDGQVDVILTQAEDYNDAYRSSRIYRFTLPHPLEIVKVEDVPDDQGRRIRIHADGYLLEAMSQDIYGMDSWSVWRMTEDSSWTNVKTVSPSNAGAGFVDVTVNKTQPTDVDSVDYSYTFRIEAFNKEKGGVIARSDTASGKAFDNIAPETVAGVSVDDQNGEKLISWETSSSNDVDKYLVYNTDADGQITGAAVGASTQTSFELPQNFEGVQNFVVKARDINNNIGGASQPVSAVYPKTIGYNMLAGWNLIGLPVDANADSIKKVLKNASNIYEYNGGYTNVSELKAGKGYWAKFTQKELAELQGLPLTKLVIDVEKGWNLISGIGGVLPTTSIKDPEGVLLSETIYAFNQAYTSVDTLRPGLGYWIRASAAGTITFMHPKLVTTGQQTQAHTNSQLAKAKDDIEQEFSTIKISDGKHNKELYFGSKLPEQVDKRKYSLPPLAPGNFFDARFSGDTRLVEKSEVKIKLNKIENTALKLKIKAANPATQNLFLVKEFGDDKLLANYKIGAGKEVKLRDKKTNAIYITPAKRLAEKQNEVPEKFELKQNYPNPFNPTTQIPYSLTETATVRLEVYNILGKKVATLIDQQMEPGTYQVTFDGSNLASGVYIYRLQAGTRVSTRKFILAK